MTAYFLACLFYTFPPGPPADVAEARWDLRQITSRVAETLDDPEVTRHVPRSDLDECWADLASLQVNLWDLDRTRESIECIADSSIRARLLSRLTRRQSECGQFDAARGTLSTLVDDEPLQWEAAAHIIEGLCAQGRLAEAITVVEELSDTSFGCYLWRSVADAAAVLADDALLNVCAARAEKDGPLCLLIAAERMAQLGHKEHARSLIQRALNLERSLDGRGNMETYTRSMRLLIRSQGRSAADHVIDEAPDEYDGALMRVAAIEMATNGSIQDAVEMFRRSVVLDPDSPPLVGLVQAVVASSALQDVFVLMDEFAAPDDWDSILTDGVIYILMGEGRQSEALEAIRRVRAADRKTGLLLQLAEQVEGNSPEARALVLTCLSEATVSIDRLSPDLSKAYNLAWSAAIWAKNGFAENATRYLTDAERLAWKYLHPEGPSTSIRELTSVISVDAYRVKSAVAYEAQGDVEMALQRISEVTNSSQREAVRQSVLVRAIRFDDVFAEALATDSVNGRAFAFQKAVEAVTDAGQAMAALQFIDEHSDLEPIVRARGLIGIATSMQRILVRPSKQL